MRGYLSSETPLGLGGSPSEVLAELFRVRPAVTLRAVPGRETFPWPEGGAPRVVVKRSDGWPWRDRWYERLRGRRRSPGRGEYENLVALAGDGIAVPRPLGWAEAPGGRSLVVMEWVEHGETLRELLVGAGEDARRRLLGPLVDLVVGLHTRGWYHRDLYLQHLVLSPVGELVLLDVGRARREPSPRRRWLVKDLGALLHSTPDSLPITWRLRFLARYLDGVGERGRAGRRRWARAVESRRRGIAGHQPRYG